jgi:hypothetical protein
MGNSGIRKWDWTGSTVTSSEETAGYPAQPPGLKNHRFAHAGKLSLFKPVFQWKERGIKK